MSKSQGLTLQSSDTVRRWRATRERERERERERGRGAGGGGGKESNTSSFTYKQKLLFFFFSCSSPFFLFFIFQYSHFFLKLELFYFFFNIIFLNGEYLDRIFPLLVLFLFLFFSHFGQKISPLGNPQKKGLKILQMFLLGKRIMAQSHHIYFEKKKCLKSDKFKA
jgi:hypothetical protein